MNTRVCLVLKKVDTFDIWNYNRFTLTRLKLQPATLRRKRRVGWPAKSKPKVGRVSQPAVHYRQCPLSNPPGPQKLPSQKPFKTLRSAHKTVSKQAQTTHNRLRWANEKFKITKKSVHFCSCDERFRSTVFWTAHRLTVGKPNVCYVMTERAEWPPAG